MREMIFPFVLTKNLFDLIKAFVITRIKYALVANEIE